MLDYRHLVQMTDETGMLQFSKFSTPDINSGYTLDDNARALMVALNMKNDYLLTLNYATWLKSALQADGSWSNLQINGVYTANFNSEDSVGRALVACSLGAASAWHDVADICKELFNMQINRVIKFRSPRAIAYSLIALCKSLEQEHNGKYEEMSTYLANKLINLFTSKSSRKWAWFENYMTYCNGILPHAMFSYYAISGDKRALKTGHSSLNFLNDTLFKQGYLNIIGNHGWYAKGKEVPLFDQQPVDAASVIFANMEAYQTIGEGEYLQLATLAYKWFRGQNIHGLSLYDKDSGGCYDALTAKGVNLNQGAEAILSLLLADTLMINFIKQDVTVEKTS